MAINVSTFSSNQSYRLTNAVLVYQDASRKPAFVSVHDVKTDGEDRPIIQAGVPASKSGLLALMRILDPETLLRPALKPAHVLAEGSGFFVWYSKPQARQVWFDCKELGARTGRVPCPGLVFVVTTRAWKVFAYKGRQRPEGDTPLFIAPFFNVWNTGTVCVGSTRLPKGDQVHNSEAWEEAFFRSYFTHPNIHTPKGLTRYRAGPFALWRDLLDGQFLTFSDTLARFDGMDVAGSLRDRSLGSGGLNGRERHCLAAVGAGRYGTALWRLHATDRERSPISGDRRRTVARSSASLAVPACSPGAPEGGSNALWVRGKGAIPVLWHDSTKPGRRLLPVCR
jgi:PRTRC genetic system protein B